jgi:hypothetical protein
MWEKRIRRAYPDIISLSGEVKRREDAFQKAEEG